MRFYNDAAWGLWLYFFYTIRKAGVTLFNLSSRRVFKE